MTLTAIRVPEWVHLRAIAVLSQYRKLITESKSPLAAAFERPRKELAIDEPRKIQHAEGQEVMGTENNEVKLLVARLKEMQERTGQKFPEWMLDENRFGKGSLTLAEQQEWAETCCRSMRGTVAMLYLIECEKRWGLRDGEYQFNTGNTVIGLTRELIESVLIQHVETPLLETKKERFLAVYQFYSANDERLADREEDWFADFLDDVFIDVAARMRSGESSPVKPSIH